MGLHMVYIFINVSQFQTSFAFNGNIQISSIQTISYGKIFFIYMAIKTWNNIQTEMKGVMLNIFIS